MRLIKLDAIDSTNDFLKAFSNNNELENFTVVIANSQTKGKGQMGTKWDSEPGKNLIMSVLIKENFVDIKQIFNLNVAVCCAVHSVLKQLKIADVKIKWPNDIMADNKKIAGILIENSIKSDGAIVSIVGIGLNVNQSNFEFLPKATSLFLLQNCIFDVDKLLLAVLHQLQINLDLIKNNKSNLLWEIYQNNLFKKQIPVAFKDANNQFFMGIVQNVTSDGLLNVLLDSDEIVAFKIKEIEMQY